MNAQYIPIEDFSSFEEWEANIQDLEEQERIIEQSIALLPPSLPQQDRLLFAVMLSNIMDAPTQQPRT